MADSLEMGSQKTKEKNYFKSKDMAQQ